ncbi:MAG: porin family protein [Tannerella sp.]|jgi:hypothetical protein|nr:porin family protein [Tannerella sp.]
MKKVMIIISLCVATFHEMHAQKFSLSANYLLLGPRGKYAYHVPDELVNHGAGVQSKIRLKNRLYLMPDIGYFFDRDHKAFSNKNAVNPSEETNSYTESSIRYYTANVNLAYDIRLAESFSLLPFAGACFLYEYTQQILHFKGEGVPSQSGGGNVDGYYGDVKEIYNYPALAVNFGLSAEYRLDRHLFLTAGVKYLFDFYETKNSSFPCLNAGVGYNF